MASKNIQTDLIGSPIVITNAWPQPTLDGMYGRIRSVYLTADGPKIIVELCGNDDNRDGHLVDLWISGVKVRGQ